jgi:hypothetical protein
MDKEMVMDTDLPPDAIRRLKDQLLIVFLKRLGGSASIPITEMDDTGRDMFYMEVDDNQNFNFTLGKKS